MYFYLQNECNNKEFWQQIGNRLTKLLKENKNFNNSFCLAQLAYIFGQLRRKNYLQNKNDIIVYQQCSNFLIHRLPKFLKDQTPQNITHFIALINQYEIKPEYVDKVVDTLLTQQDFSTFSIFDIQFLLWSLVSGSNKQLVQFSIQLLENKQIVDRIKSDFHKLKEDQQAKVLIALGQFRFNDKECIEQIVKDLKIYSTSSLLSLLSKYLKSPMNQILYQYQIVIALKEQFDEYFQMEDKDLQKSILGIKTLLYIPSQINSEVRQKFLQPIKQYERFILNNIEHFTNESLIDIINMASLFESEKLILEKVKNKIQNFHMILEDSVSFLYCIEKYSHQFHQQINDCLTALINIHAHEIQTLNISKHLQFVIALQLLEDQFPIAKVLQAYYDDKKIQIKLIETIKKDQMEKFISNFQFQRQFKYFQGFMENNFEYNLFLFEKQGLLKYIKESRVGCYLIDYRIWDINIEKLDIQELKQMQKSNDLQTEFLEVKQNKYDDATIDRKDEIGNTFIEIDGSCHFDIRLDVVTQTVYKKKILNKYQINLKSIPLNENRGISNSLQAILDIIGK
ncbi:unnamed protein product (macronuclear) [Paramecium tetraurelia]|uniref:Uncharacterized protein n=1 Tax=Paramecium tetraurelia TaxID=5888 RepID=A0BDF5_PARTE|nr:uncharacterized protein GSPATT00027600001 [Paramecium tetraurelia]CAK56572.1 unnamed protein product [Paramecium tetraurelia]|eukprot:XP_001423970.1 hypothetical protein (macronuclear) [Paramecium tetraurelia strain d4-2]